MVSLQAYLPDCVEIQMRHHVKTVDEIKVVFVLGGQARLR